MSSPEKQFAPDSFIEIDAELPPETLRKLLMQEITTPHERVLRESPIEAHHELGGGAFHAEFVKIKNDGAAIFKPYERYKKSPLLEYERNMRIVCERAAYLVDRFLGFNFVPPVVIREIDGRKGSLQEFIPDAKDGCDTDDFTEEDAIKLNLFDVIIQNEDRHGGNFLVAHGMAIAIDHGESFDAAYAKIPYCVGEEVWLGTWGNHLSEPLQNNLARFSAWREGQELLQDLLSELLGEETAEAYMRRIRAVLGAIDENGYLSQERFSEKLKEQFRTTDP